MAAAETTLLLDRMNGVWSATPTPFTENMEIDAEAIPRMVRHHLRLGVRGLFVCGTCGEGPWMTDLQRQELVRRVADCSAGRLLVAAQVTDNSAARIYDNMWLAQENGADIVVIAPPYFLLNATPATIASLYLEAIRRSPLPVGIYDRGLSGAVVVPNDVLAQVYAEGNVVLVKDSSNDPERRDIALAARAERPGLHLLTGNEFTCVDYLMHGYDGLLLGGGIFNGYMARKIMGASRRRELDVANALQERMNRLMWDVYGGKEITCWLTGLKHLLVQMGIFTTTRNYLGYPLTDACRAAIEAALEREAEMLGIEGQPWPSK